LAYRRTGHSNIHVRRYKEKGNINTPMELAINNEIDRFTLAIEVMTALRSFRGSVRTRKNTTMISRPIAATTHTRTVSRPGPVAIGLKMSPTGSSPLIAQRGATKSLTAITGTMVKNWHSRTKCLSAAAAESRPPFSLSRRL
jgi:hypothetical protein